jgi:hypothetical protein
MKLRDIFVSIGCCAAAVSVGFGKPARADELQSGNGTASRAAERCAASGAPVEETAGCERIDGHVRVEFGSRKPDLPGHGRPGASPIAVRLDDGATSRGHLRLPAGQSGIDSFPR